VGDKLLPTKLADFFDADGTAHVYFALFRPKTVKSRKVA
jgi:hypothetical protein